MASLAAVLLATLELEDHKLLAAPLGNNLTRDRSARYERAAKLGGIAAKKENLAKSYFVAFVTCELLDSNEIALSDAILFAAGADYCVCHGEGPRKLDPSPMEGKEAKTQIDPIFTFFHENLPRDSKRDSFEQCPTSKSAP